MATGAVVVSLQVLRSCVRQGLLVWLVGMVGWYGWYGWLVGWLVVVVVVVVVVLEQKCVVK